MLYVSAERCNLQIDGFSCCSESFAKGKHLHAFARAGTTDGNKERLFCTKNQNKGKSQAFSGVLVEKGWIHKKTEETWWEAETQRDVYQPVNIDIISSWSRIGAAALLKFLLDPREGVRERVLLQHRLEMWKCGEHCNVENSPAPVGPWYIALKTCCSWNVKHYVKFSNQPISLNISHENWFRWRHKNPDQKDSFQKLATLEQFNLPLCPCISGRLTTKAPTVTVGRNQKPPPRSFGKVGKIQQMPWKMSTILPSISHFFQLFVGRIRFLIPDHPN